MVVTGTLGGSVILPLQLQDGQQVESISWMCRSVPGAIATVTLVEPRGPDTFYQAERQYWGRLSVLGPGCSLQISHLSWEDAGSYRAHVNLWSSCITHAWEYSLHVCGECLGNGNRWVCVVTVFQSFFFFLINLFILFIYFWLLWVFIAVHGLSLVVVSGRTLCCGASASHCGGLGSRHLGFSSCGTQASVVVARGL